MKVQNVIEGLKIIHNRKPPEASDYHLRAEHDRIWAGSLDWPIAESEQHLLEELGFNKDEEADGWTAMI